MRVFELENPSRGKKTMIVRKLPMRTISPAISQEQQERKDLLKKAKAGSKRARKTLWQRWRIRVYTEAEVRQYERQQNERDSRPARSRADMSMDDIFSSIPRVYPLYPCTLFPG